LKKANKMAVGIIVASLLTIPCVHPGQPALAAAIKQEQTKISHPHKEDKQSSTQSTSGWDRSSLSFVDSTETLDGIAATIQNGPDSETMQGEVKYEVYWSAQGNPKDGKVVATGVVKALTSGETQVLTYIPDQLTAGNYMFKAYQRPNHPGTGQLWSESITVKNQSDGKIEPERPLDQFFHSSVNDGTATFTVPEGMKPVEISFTSYVYPEGIVQQEDGKPYEGQTAYDNVTKVYKPGTYTIEVDLPKNGYWQTDLYLGPEINQLSESGHPADKIIDADYGYKN
jgi:YqxM protein